MTTLSVKLISIIWPIIRKRLIYRLSTTFSINSPPKSGSATKRLSLWIMEQSKIPNFVKIWIPLINTTLASVWIYLVDITWKAKWAQLSDHFVTNEWKTTLSTCQPLWGYPGTTWIENQAYETEFELSWIQSCTIPISVFQSLTDCKLSTTFFTSLHLSQ